MTIIKIIITVLAVYSTGITMYAIYFKLPESGIYTTTVEEKRSQQLKQLVGTSILLSLIWLDLL